MKQPRNTWFAAGLAAVIAGMTGMAFASVPLYKAFCAATGYGGTPNTSAAAAPGAVKRMITVDFNANTNPGLPWVFKAEQDKITLPMGQDQVAYYEARNTGDTAVIKPVNSDVDIAVASLLKETEPETAGAKR